MSLHRIFKISGCALLSILILVGCATTDKTGATRPIDPLEPLNRKIYGFNSNVDTYVARPIALGYRAITPQPVRTGLYNFFANFNDVPITFNKLLQFEFKEAGISASRFVLNSTLGVFGLIDVAGYSNIEKQQADFGQTLGLWGIKYSPYIVLPGIRTQYH